MMKIEDYKEEIKNENLGEDEFVSRLDGSIQKKNGRKTINDGSVLPEYISKSFQMAADCFRLNDRSDPNMVKYLYKEWGFPKNIVDLVFHEFGESFDESQKFLMLMDSADGNTYKEKMRNAWEIYSDEFEVYGGPSTVEFTKFVY